MGRSSAAFLIQHYVKPRRRDVRERKERRRQRRKELKDDAEFRKGDRIEAKLDREWISGTIRRVNDNGTYDINFCDGTVERGMDDRLVRYPKRYDRDFSRDESAPSASEQESDVLYEKNEKIEARFRGGKKWFSGTLLVSYTRFFFWNEAFKYKF